MSCALSLQCVCCVLCVQTAVGQHFKEKMAAVFSHIASVGKKVTADDMRSLMFGDYMRQKDEKRSYDEIRDIAVLTKVLSSVLTKVFIHL